VADHTPQTASAALALVGAAGVTNALAPADRSGGGAAGASALTHCARCDRPRHLGVGWCGTWCGPCLAQWIADGQPAPAETGRIGRTYRLQHDGPVSA
jgi:hypothetical protein